MSPRRLLVAVVSGVLAIALGLAWWHQRTATPQDGQSVATWTPAAAASGPSHQATTASGSTDPTSAVAGSGPATTSGSGAASPSGGASSTPTASSTPAGCATTLSPIVPTRFTIPAMGIDAPVLSLGLAADGSVATPPLDQPRTVAWWRGGPKPGSSRGKVVLTTHTFHVGGALGNDLFDRDKGLKTGDVIQLSDGAGHVQCYRYTHAIKVMVADYDPASKVLYDPSGAPMLAIIICWDYRPATKVWDSRVIFYATPLAH